MDESAETVLQRTLSGLRQSSKGKLRYKRHFSHNSAEQICEDAVQDIRQWKTEVLQRAVNLSIKCSPPAKDMPKPPKAKKAARSSNDVSLNSVDAVIYEDQLSPNQLISLYEKKRMSELEHKHLERCLKQKQEMEKLHESFKNKLQEAVWKQERAKQQLELDIREQQLKVEMEALEEERQRQVRYAEHRRKLLEKIGIAQEEQKKEQKQQEQIKLQNKTHIQKCQSQFKEAHERIIKSVEEICSHNSLDETIEECVQKFETLKASLEELNADDATLQCVERATLYNRQAQLLAASMRECLTKMRLRWAEEMKKQASPPVVKPPAPTAAVKSVETTTSSVPLQPTLRDCVNPASLAWYQNLQEILTNTQKECEIITENSAQRNFKFMCNKAINHPVNAISPVSAAHLTDKFITLSRLLAGQSVAVAGSQICAAQHPQGILYCKVLLAEKLVKQGEDVVSSSPDAAFSIAAVAHALWCQYPDFGTLFLAQFHRKCPYLVPYYIPQTEGQSEEDYYRELGYRYRDGQVEQQNKFLKRMDGVVRLYAALFVSPLPKSLKHMDRPHPDKYMWMWLSSILNLHPHSDITATTLIAFLEVCGNALIQKYRHQSQKLLHALAKMFYPFIKKVTRDGAGGPVQRLEMFLQNCLKHGHISLPSGALGPNFW